MGRARQAAAVAIDTSVVRYFYAAGFLAKLIGYLGQGVAVYDVQQEIKHQSASRADLAAILAGRGWPARLQGTLTASEKADALRIQAEWIREDRKKDPTKKPRPDEHLGEISTVLIADRTRTPMVAMDDGRGRALAGIRKIAVISSGGLAIEMTAEGALTLDEGWLVYDRATSNATRSEFDRLVLDTSRG